MNKFLSELQRLLWVVTHCSSEQYGFFIRWPVGIEPLEEWDTDDVVAYIVRFQSPALGFRISQIARDKYRKEVLGIEEELDEIPF
jgi:hypothetical protein